MLYHLLEAGEIAEAYTFSAEEKAALEHELKRLVARIEGVEAFTARTSVLCHWCPFNPQCAEGSAWMTENAAPGHDTPIDLGI